MKVAFYTIDYCSERAKLMPWKTIVEVANEMILHKLDVEILSASSEYSKSDNFVYKNVKIINIPLGEASFYSYCIDRKYDVLFYPVTWRSGLTNFNSISKIDCKKIAYFPGGVYSIKNVLALWNWGARTFELKSYLMEYLVPKFLILNKLKKIGFTKIIALSDLTAKNIKKIGKIEVVTLLPGKNNFQSLDSNFNLLNKYNLADKKFYLFTGAPAITRGSNCLLTAFDLFAKTNSDAFLVFLMRKDIGSDFNLFLHNITKIQHKDKILIIREDLNQNELKSFFSMAYAVVLPFLVIPSEIPLTYFEVLECGTPIITFENGGTTDYLQKAILVGKPGSKKSLSKIMNQLWVNKNQRDELSKNAVSILKLHPNWSEVADGWIKLL